MRGKRALDGLERDIHDHIERETQDYIDRGLSPAEARRKAMIAFGSVVLTTEDTRRVWVSVWLGHLVQDGRYALRTFARNPVFTVVAVSTLALGIGATASVFSVISAVLLRPLPNENANRLVRIVENVPAAESIRGVAMRSSAMSEEEFIWWRTHLKTLDMAVSMPEARTTRTPDGTVRLSGARVSPAWFQLYGVKPLLGRVLLQDEERPDSRVVVLSATTWRRYFGSDPTVLDRTMVLDGQALSIVGIAPAQDDRIAFWIPFSAGPSRPGTSTFVGVAARLRDHVSLEAATTEVNALGDQLRGGIPREPGAPLRFEVVSVRDEMVARVRPALRILTVAVGVVLLVVCANVANLLLARGTARGREMGIRRALGAGRARVVRQVLAESLILSVSGALVGIAIAIAGVQFVKPLALYGLPEKFRGALGPAVLDTGVLPRIQEVAIDGPVLTFVVGVSVLTGVLFGIAPALRLARVEHLQVLAQANVASRIDGSGRRANRLGDALAISQLGMATTLLVVTGLLVHSFVKLSSIDIGFDPRVLTFELVVPQDYTSVRQIALAQGLSDRLRSLPFVTAAGFIDRPPLSRMGASWQGPVVPLDREWLGMDRADMAVIRSVSSDYLRALGVELVAGNWLENRDSGPPALLVNRAYARRFFGDRSPIGATLRWGTVGSFQVVGVVEDIWLHLPSSPDDKPEHAVFMKPRPTQVERDAAPSPSFAVRVMGDPLSIVPEVRRILAEIDPALAVDGVTTLDRVIDGLHTRPRFYAVLLSIFSGFAAFIAAIGIYGVLAYGVTQRTQEIGIRMALGARRSEVMRMVLSQATVLVAVGIILGLFGAVGATRYLEAMLFGLTPLDLPTYAVVAFIFAAVAMLSSYVPARRATKVNPLVALRFE